MLQEDNSGFVLFPQPGNNIIINHGEKTLAYIAAFEPKKSGILSNINISLPGDFVSDDIIDRNNSNDVIRNQTIQDEYNELYFPNQNSDNNMIRSLSIPMISCICIGWSNNGYEYNGHPWVVSFRDLTEEGKRLYYSMKKLHNNKEIRILTFNNI